ncbi:MAG: NYN domain-containing protein [Candidatus Micrarchaeota archaeon]|nr:NYN domain-containing protein [Candidatus Micrarchaeota archaeon]
MDILSIFGKKKEEKEVFAVFVDGPNMIRKDAKIDLAEVKGLLLKDGVIHTASVYVDQYASGSLIEAIINQGYKAIVTSGDVDVAMATDSVFYAATQKEVTAVVFVTRDTDFVPAITRIKELGKKIYILSINFGFSSALSHYADKLIMLPERPQQHYSQNQNFHGHNPHQRFKMFHRRENRETDNNKVNPDDEHSTKKTL